jgi:hypothetical protein
MIGSAFFALFPLIFSGLTIWVPAVGAGLLILTLALHPGGLGEQLDPIVKWFRGAAPGRAAGAQLLVVFGLLCMLGAVLSALQADAVWILLAGGAGFLCWMFRKRPAHLSARVLLHVLAAMNAGGALAMVVLWGVWSPLAFAVPVPLFIRAAYRVAAPLHAAAAHGPSAVQEPEPVGAA